MVHKVAFKLSAPVKRIAVLSRSSRSFGNVSYLLRFVKNIPNSPGSCHSFVKPRKSTAARRMPNNAVIIGAPYNTHTKRVYLRWTTCQTYANEISIDKMSNISEQFWHNSYYFLHRYELI